MCLVIYFFYQIMQFHFFSYKIVCINEMIYPPNVGVFICRTAEEEDVVGTE